MELLKAPKNKLSRGIKTDNQEKIGDIVEARVANCKAIQPANWGVDLGAIMILNEIRAAKATDKNHKLVDEVTANNLGN